MIFDHFCEGFLRQNVSARSEPLIPANWTSRTRSRLHNTHLQSLLKYYSLCHLMNKRRTGDTGTCCRAETRQKERRTKEIITVVTIITIMTGHWHRWVAQLLAGRLERRVLHPAYHGAGAGLPELQRAIHRRHHNVLHTECAQNIQGRFFRREANSVYVHITKQCIFCVDAYFPHSYLSYAW